MIQHEFVDAQAMKKQHPETFQAPSMVELANIQVGDFAKVNPGTERFWVQITQVEEGVLIGRIDNELVCTEDHGLRYNDSIRFEHRHVHQIMR